jgi:hypothetical protein
MSAFEKNLNTKNPDGYALQTFFLLASTFSTCKSVGVDIQSSAPSESPPWGWRASWEVRLSGRTKYRVMRTLSKRRAPNRFQFKRMIHCLLCAVVILWPRLQRVTWNFFSLIRAMLID